MASREARRGGSARQPPAGGAGTPEGAKQHQGRAAPGSGQRPEGGAAPEGRSYGKKGAPAGAAAGSSRQEGGGAQHPREGVSA